MSRLPIELIPGHTPPKFRWRQVVDTFTGKQTIECEGLLPAGADQAVIQLIDLAKKQARDLMVANGSIHMTVDRLGGTVEGAPTHEGNFLQRIDELVAIETASNVSGPTEDDHINLTELKSTPKPLPQQHKKVR